jgi:hypothetical protein
MIRLMLLIAVVFGAIYLVRWFLTTPAETVAANVRKSLWLVLGLGLLLLAASGRLNIIFAFIGSAIPLVARHLPNILRILGLVKTFKSAKENNQAPPQPPATQGMSKKDALEILGLNDDASKKAITGAHKRLMQKNHPDKGGSAHLASQINQAKKILMAEHEH